MNPSPSLESLATPLLWLADDERVAGCNPAAARWLGMSARRLVGMPLAELDGEHGRVAALMARVADGAEPLRVRRACVRGGDGSERFADLWLLREGDRVQVEVHPADEFPGEDPATLLPAALSAALKGLAHEVRNPLAGIKGAAQLLARRAQARGDEGDDHQLIGLISAEVERLAALVERLLNPQAPNPLQPTNIHAVLERVRQLADAEAGWAIRLERDYDPSLPEFDADPDRLVQALWNLVHNALESGAGSVTLRTRAERNVLIGDTTHRLALRVEIIDDGRGVPESLAERIFLPLVTGRAEGTGLGLPLAQQVAREHGGSLGYRSRPGHTVFTLLLPALEPAPPEPGSDEAAPRDAAGEAAHAG
ncbi:two-component system sensor histidine kinase NtrB [Alkalisalibacterium limincola]|uniref:histidine kinase n=1 Tax=Alkalisalibacterium limincola TaxID=2699169 RepID=A0A5C8KKT7_9GAMM|nr:ATP-binding protein [Alkalisalibacterium limincola]TXK60761.1 PAS domain-containing protein [Alkalisalibacterium limincola]